MLFLLLFLVLIWALAVPAWPYHRRYGYGYYPFGVISMVLLVFILLWVFGVLVVAI